MIFHFNFVCRYKSEYYRKFILIDPEFKFSFTSEIFLNHKEFNAINFMKVENTNLANQIKDVYISDSGIFYFLDEIIISEINEGVTFTWHEAQEIIHEALKHYPSGKQICYISNRVNKYSVKPQDWLKFEKTNLKLNGYAIVTEFESSWQSALMEKFFFRFKMERYNDLYAAINWCRLRNQSEYRQFNVG